MFSANSSQVSDEKLYVEDVFSTYLYTGTGSAQTITNGVDLAGKGGMVWIKSRSDATDNFLFDTVRGVNVEINSNTADPNTTLSNSLTAFNSNGFSISSATGIGVNAATYASFTFRKAPKFFDVITYVGNGVSGRSIPHSLGVAPGFIVTKQISGLGASSRCYHRASSGTPTQDFMILESTSGTFPQGSAYWGASASDFSLYGIYNDANSAGVTYVAYLFAHDTTSDGIIQCGSYVRTGSSVSVNLGWEPQWVLVKKATDINGFGGSNWAIADNMRGFDVTSWSRLNPNTTNAETTGVSGLSPNATGFTVTNASGQADSGETYIYIAIRRGPMRTPTSGTSVFAPVIGTTASATSITTGFPVDMMIFRPSRDVDYNIVQDRLRGGTKEMYTQLTDAEGTIPATNFDRQTSVVYNAVGAGGSYVAWNFKRAPSFFDEVCYTGTGVANRTVNHNLGVVPELMIVKSRSLSSSWPVYSAGIANGNLLFLNGTAASAGPYPTFFGNDTTSIAPTATAFTVGTATQVNSGNNTYVAYLFASCPGVSKVGSYTGNGSSQTINCGFAAGARFVMIKRTDSTGDWYVWDTARGIVAANDPHLSLNTTAAEVTTDDSIDPDNSGFIVNQVAATNINVSSATYIYLAVA